MYTIRNFGDMIGDHKRFVAYSRAIASAVRPGDAVVEIGCGPAVFSFLACHAGARNVYAIETEQVIALARTICTENGLSDRVQFFHSDARKTALPERVNVMISDIRGTLPLFGHAIPTIEDARNRFLAPGGTVIPQRDVLKVAVIEAEEFYAGLTSPWLKSTPNLKLEAALPLVLNSFHGAKFKELILLAEPQIWHEIDYTKPSATRAAGEVEFHVTQSGIGHGLCMWFDTLLFADIGFSTAPGAGATIYGQLFFPWLQPVALREGQKIQVRLHADLVGKDYFWRWETDISSMDGRSRKQFRQSTFEAASLSPQMLRHHAADHVPSLTEEGEAECFFLQEMNGASTLEEIASKAAAKFPKLFPQRAAAFQRATGLAQKFSR